MFGNNFTGRSRQSNLTLATDRVADRSTTLANVRAQREQREREAKMRRSCKAIQALVRGYQARSSFRKMVANAIIGKEEGDGAVLFARMWVVVRLASIRQYTCCRERFWQTSSGQCLLQLQQKVSSALQLHHEVQEFSNVLLLGKVLFSLDGERIDASDVGAFAEAVGLSLSHATPEQALTGVDQWTTYALQVKGSTLNAKSVRCSLTILSSSILQMSEMRQYGLQNGSGLAKLLLLSDEVCTQFKVDPFSSSLSADRLTSLDVDFWKALSTFASHIDAFDEEARIRISCRLLKTFVNDADRSALQMRYMWDAVRTLLIETHTQSTQLGHFLLKKRWGRQSCERSESELTGEEVTLHPTLESRLSSFQGSVLSEPLVSPLHNLGLQVAASTLSWCVEDILRCEALLSKKFVSTGSIFQKAFTSSVTALKDGTTKDEDGLLDQIADSLHAIDTCCGCFLCPWLALTAGSSLQSNKRRRAVPLLSMIAEQFVTVSDGARTTLLPVLWTVLEALAEEECGSLFMGGRFAQVLLSQADSSSSSGARFKAALPNLSLLFLNLFSFYTQSTDFSGDLVSGRIPLAIHPSSDALGSVLSLFGALKEVVLISHLQGCECSSRSTEEVSFITSTGLSSSTAEVAQACYRLMAAIHVVDESTNFVERVLLPWQKSQNPNKVVSTQSDRPGLAKNKNDWWAVPTQRYSFPAVLSYDEWSELTKMGGGSDAAEAHPAIIQMEEPGDEEAVVLQINDAGSSSSDDEPSTLAAERARSRLPSHLAVRGKKTALVSKMKNVAMEHSSTWNGTQKVMMLLQHCPFLVPFANRVSIFSSLIFADRQRSGGGFRTHQFGSDVLVERGSAFVDAYTQLRSVPVQGLRGSLPVRFYRGDHTADEPSSNPRSNLLRVNQRYQVRLAATNSFQAQLDDLDERLEEMESQIEEIAESDLRDRMMDMVRELHESREDLAGRIAIVPRPGLTLIGEEDLERGYGDGVQRDFINELCQDGFGSVRGLFAEAVGVDVTTNYSSGAAETESDARVVGVFPSTLLTNLLQRDDREIRHFVHLRQKAQENRDERTSQAHLTSINRRAQLIHDTIEDEYRFLGSMVGKALRDGVLLDVSFAHFFRNLLLGRVNGVSDVASYDAVMYRSFAQLRSMAHDELQRSLNPEAAPGPTISDLELRFTVSTVRVQLLSSTTRDEDSGGDSDENRGMETIEVPLLPGGENIPVTALNLPMYLHLVADYRLNKSVRRFSDAFRRGLYSLVDPSWLRLFDARELHILFCGGDEGMVGLDVTDWQQNTMYSGELINPAREGITPEEMADRSRRATGAPTFRNLSQNGLIGSTATRTIGMFWDVVAHDFTPHQQRLMLKFATSLSRAPLLGFGFMNPAFNIVLSGGDTDRLPSAATCMCMLSLPQYPDRATMKDKLLKAIEGTNTFEMS